MSNCNTDFINTVEALNAVRDKKLTECNSDPECESKVWVWYGEQLAEAIAVREACLNGS